MEKATLSGQQLSLQAWSRTQDHQPRTAQHLSYRWAPGSGGRLGLPLPRFLAAPQPGRFGLRLRWGSGVAGARTCLLAGGRVGGRVRRGSPAREEQKEGWERPGAERRARAGEREKPPQGASWGGIAGKSPPGLGLRAGRRPELGWGVATVEMRRPPAGRCGAARREPSGSGRAKPGSAPAWPGSG